VVTFDPHPRALLIPERAPQFLTVREQQVRRLGDLGVEAVVILPFTRELAHLDAGEFLRQHLLVEAGGLRGICVGERWRFGAGGRGDAELLRAVGRQWGFPVVCVPELWWYGKPVSSTRIREAVRRGRLASVRRLLGRPYTLLGRVVSGRGFGGPVLGFPTANLHLRGVVLPPCGVYAARGWLVSPAGGPLSGPCAGALYIGTAPTLGQKHGPAATQPVAEMHFLDLHQDLRGSLLEVEVIEFLRPDRLFPSVDELRRQIEVDIAAIRRLLPPSA
jgi:riboflavin kinase/FMN adenylyltransferase